MNPGKAIAQGSHAANAAAKHAERDAKDLYSYWAFGTSQDFGTVLTLDGGSMDDIKELIAQIEAERAVRKDSGVSGVILDPTYPLRDGSYTHYIPVETCAYVLCYKDSPAHRVIKHLELHK
jgi:hypothetical protein